MLSPAIEALLGQLSAAVLTDIFLIILFLIFGISLFFLKSQRHTAMTSYTPTLLTSIGILGTFVGIVVGLLRFDTTALDLSIGPLLEGLKTAFITSLFGMLLSIIYKTLSLLSFFQPQSEDDDKEVNDFYTLLEKQQLSLEAQTTQLELLKSSINDDSDVSLAARLTQQLQDFSDQLSNSASQQMTAALEKSVLEFNNTLVEKCGENFTRFNEAIAQLNDWQTQYKDQLSDMQQQYSQSVESITHTEQALSAISQQTQSIPDNLSVLANVIEKNEEQIKLLESQLSTLAETRDKAVNAIPEIRDQVEKTIQLMANELATVTGKFTEDYTKLVQQMSNIINTQPAAVLTAERED